MPSISAPLKHAPDMYSKVEVITPQLAARWLASNDGNRKIIKNAVEEYARAIVNGRFKLTHQGIAFSRGGRLLDGQHRLTAIVMAGVSVQMMVTYNVPDDAFAHMDTQRTRPLAFRLRRDPVRVSIINTMWKFVYGNGRPIQEYEAELMLDLFDDALSAIESIPRRPRRKVESAITLAAATLRIAELLKDGAQDEVLRLQWMLEKIRADDLNGLPKVVHQYVFSKLESSARGDRFDDLVRAWKLFGPGIDSLVLLKIPNQQTLLKQMRATFARLTESVFEDKTSLKAK